MPPQVSRLSNAAGALLRGFTSGQKAVTALALVALLVGGFAFTSWAGRPSMVPLFTSLEASDAAAVTEELTGKGVPYTLADSGRTSVTRSPLPARRGSSVVGCLVPTRLGCCPAWSGCGTTSAPG